MQSKIDYPLAYPFVYTGFMIPFKRGKTCKAILNLNGRILLEFSDLTRHWAYSRDLKTIESISQHELRSLTAR